MPPSRSKIDPVAQVAGSKYSIASLMSLCCPIRFSGAWAPQEPTPSGQASAIPGLSISPKRSPLTRQLGANSTAADRVSASSAAFVAP